MCRHLCLQPSHHYIYSHMHTERHINDALCSLVQRSRCDTDTAAHFKDWAYCPSSAQSAALLRANHNNDELSWNIVLDTQEWLRKHRDHNETLINQAGTLLALHRLKVKWYLSLLPPNIILGRTGWWGSGFGPRQGSSVWSFNVHPSVVSPSIQNGAYPGQVHPGKWEL